MSSPAQEIRSIWPYLQQAEVAPIAPVFSSHRGTPAHRTALIHMSLNLAVTVAYAVSGGTATNSGTDYTLAKVSYPYTRPEVKTFVENVSAEYRKACGEQLVVTSLTRPRTAQPGNAHKLSVHPAGMAVDFRISRNAKCRTWFEKALLALETRAVLDATRERNPPHYHVAVFPDAYRSFAARQKPAAERPSPSPTVLRPKAISPEPAAPAAPSAGAAPNRPAQAQPVRAEPPLVLVLISSIALLFLVGWRVARHHGPG